MDRAEKRDAMQSLVAVNVTFNRTLGTSSVRSAPT